MGEGYCPMALDCSDPDYVCLSFFIDDSANMVYDDAAMLEWKGSLTWDEATNTVAAGSWDGPFPPPHRRWRRVLRDG